MKETHNQKIVKTLLKGWKCYGMILEENEYASSLPRTTAKLREKLDTSKRDFDKGLIGVLLFEDVYYEWYEKMDGLIKYFRLKEIGKRNYFVEQTNISESGQVSLF
jgi:hypothetical protein